MAETPPSDVHLEAVETSLDEGKEPDEAGSDLMAGLPERKQPEGIPGGCGKRDIDSNDYK